MYVHGDQLPEGTVLQGFDLAIIGAGAAGIAMARRLANTSVKVVLLVSGHKHDKGLPNKERQSIYHGTVGKFLEKVDPIFVHRSRLNMYGGTTNHFGFWSRPLDDADYMSRPGYRDAGWLFGADEMKPYYEDAHEFGHFGPFNYDDMPFWERVLYARSFDPMNDDTLEGAIMHAQYEENLHDFQVQFRQELMSAENITVLFNAHVVSLESNDEQDHVTGLNCSTIVDGKAGTAFQVHANKYTLATGGIENVRLLKLSGNLGDNKKGHLGHGFMVHPLLTSSANVYFDQPIASDIRNFFREQQIRFKPPTDPNGDYEHMVAPLVNPEMVFDYLMFNAWGILVPKHETLLKEKIGNFRIILRFGHDNKSAAVNLNWEQVPNEDSYVGLNPEQVDPVFGQPVAHVDWNMREEDKRSAVRALELTRDYLAKRGGQEWEWITDVSGGANDWLYDPHEGALETGDHHMGSLRMSESAEDGIVDINSKMHAVDNLYIAGCGVFPTGGYANPTLTIVALALRLADHLKSVS